MDDRQADVPGSESNSDWRTTTQTMVSVGVSTLPASSPIEGKVRVPSQAIVSAVTRTRLVSDGWTRRSRPLTLIVAPAGYGKTTAAVQLVSQRGGTVAWLTIDPRDNDLSRFTAYVIAAIARASNLDIQQATGVTTAESIVAAINAAVDGAGEPITLVLDDLHLITNSDVLDEIALLISFPPSGFDLVITSRSVPKLPLARWRLHGLVRDITADDLRFTLDEARELLVNAGRQSLDDGDVARLHARTEGWAAALRLATLTPAERLLTSETRLLDFLEDEVLDRLAAEDLAFLLRTAPLDRLSDSLCRAVVPDAIVPALRELERRGILISALDDVGEWFRYHALLSAALRRRLAERAGPNEMTDIHRRASDWFAAHGDPESAIDHALQASDWPRATNMIQPLMERMASRNRIDRLHDWLLSLPHAEVRESADFSYWVSWTLVREGLVSEAERHIARAEQLWRDAGNASMLAAALNVRATMAFYRGRGNECSRLAREAEQRLPAEFVLERQTARLNQALGASMNGRATEAAGLFAELLSEDALAPSIRLTADVQLGWVEMMQGRLGHARARFERVCSEHNGLRLDVLRRAHVWLADIALEQGRDEEAEALVRHAERMAEQAGSRLLIADTSRRRARIALRRGDPAAALRALDDCLASSFTGEATPIASRQQAMRVACWTQLGQDDDVRRWVAELHLSTIGHLRFGTQDQYLAYARWLAARGRYAPAHSISERLCRLAEADGRYGHLLAFLILRAQTEIGLKEEGKAAASITRALELGARGDYHASFAHADERVRQLMRRVAKRGTHADFVARVLSSSADADDPALPLEIVKAGSGPLTAREQEVLQLVAIGYSNQDISTQLGITVWTVKRHVSNVLDKLDVSSRTEAVFNARQLGLLPR